MEEYNLNDFDSIINHIQYTGIFNKNALYYSRRSKFHRMQIQANKQGNVYILHRLREFKKNIYAFENEDRELNCCLLSNALNDDNQGNRDTLIKYLILDGLSHVSFTEPDGLSPSSSRNRRKIVNIKNENKLKNIKLKINEDIFNFFKLPLELINIVTSYIYNKTINDL